MRQGGNCHQFSEVQTSERRVDHLTDRHDSVGRKVADRHPRRVPECSRRRAGQHDLESHALIGEFVMQRLRESQHERLRPAIHAIQHFRSDRCDR